MTTPPESSPTGPLLRLIGLFAFLSVVVMSTAFWTIMRSPVALMPTPDAVPSVAAVAASPEAMTALQLTTPPKMAAPRQSTPKPAWIWAPGETSAEQTVWFQRTITPTEPIRRAQLLVSADNHAVIRIGDEEIGRTTDWQRPESFDVTAAAKSGEIDLRIEARNDGGPAGLIALLTLEGADGRTSWVLSDESWTVADDAAFSAPRPAVELGLLGVAPWGNLSIGADEALERNFQVLEGFTVELVYNVPSGSGSWVSLAADGTGRLIACAQYGGLYRITPEPAGSDRPASVEPIEVDLTGAQGLLVHDGALFCMIATGPPEARGLYRVTDSDGDDQYDTTELVRVLPNNGGEHGPHAIVPGPDGLLYVVAGNHVPLPDMERSTVPRVWQEDHLLPRLWDARGHAVGILAPGGWIARVDPDGGPWELVCTGFRNCYDLAFDSNGELFTYDADMEWDMGAPWYRPTRLNHVVSGADFGWRSGTAKWPSEFPDSLPATLDIGPGSPTGVRDDVRRPPDARRRELLRQERGLPDRSPAPVDRRGHQPDGWRDVLHRRRPSPGLGAVPGPSPRRAAPVAPARAGRERCRCPPPRPGALSHRRGARVRTGVHLAGARRSGSVHPPRRPHRPRASTRRSLGRQGADRAQRGAQGTGASRDVTNGRRGVGGSPAQRPRVTALDRSRRHRTSHLAARHGAAIHARGRPRPRPRRSAGTSPRAGLPGR
ncbi:MAG: hypothetical protein ACYTF9_06205 [Planctomycetota bacterium]|jgi:hypothetical protein